MKRVYCSEDRLLVGFLKGVLDGHHIDCLVKNEYLIGGIGELPPGACWPELWVPKRVICHRPATSSIRF